MDGADGWVGMGVVEDAVEDVAAQASTSLLVILVLGIMCLKELEVFKDLRS